MTGTSSKRAPAFSFRSFRETFALDRRNSQHHGYDCLWLLGRVQRRASCCLMTSFQRANQWPRFNGRHTHGDGKKGGGIMKPSMVLKIWTGTRDESELACLTAHSRTCTRCFSSPLHKCSVVNFVSERGLKWRATKQRMGWKSHRSNPCPFQPILTGINWEIVVGEREKKQ